MRQTAEGISRQDEHRVAGELADGWRCELLEPKALDGIRVRFLTSAGAAASLAELLAFLDRHGETPLPPWAGTVASKPNASNPSPTTNSSSAIR